MFPVFFKATVSNPENYALDFSDLLWYLMLLFSTERWQSLVECT